MFNKPKRNFIKSFYKPRIMSSIFNLSFGNYGFICLEPFFLNKERLESIRLIATRAVRRRRYVYLNLSKRRGWMKLKPSFNIALTKKGSKSRMGKGKGPIDRYIHSMGAYQCFLELKTIPFYVCLSLLKSISHKMGIKMALICKAKKIYYIC